MDVEMESLELAGSRGVQEAANEIWRNSFSFFSNLKAKWRLQKAVGENIFISTTKNLSQLDHNGTYVDSFLDRLELRNRYILPFQAWSFTIINLSSN